MICKLALSSKHVERICRTVHHKHYHTFHDGMSVVGLATTALEGHGFAQGIIGIIFMLAIVDVLTGSHPPEPL